MFPPVKTKTRSQLALLFSVPLAFSLLFFLASQIVEHTNTNLTQIETLSSSLRTILSLVKDVEDGERGFLLTGDDQYLIPLQRANAWLPSEMRLCQTYAEDLPSMQSAVRTAIGLAQRRLNAAANVLVAQRNNGFESAIQLMKFGDGERVMNQLCAHMAAVQSRLSKAANDTLEKQRVLNRWAFFFFLGGTIVMVIVLLRLYMDVVSYIDSRDQAQTALQALNKDLEARIAESTRELRQSNQELEQFAYVASHDLQEPLRTVTSFTQLLAVRYKGRLDDDADEYIGYIVNASRKMAGLINGLLALARVRKSEQFYKPVSFEELLQDAKCSLQAAIRENNVRIEYERLPALAVDHLQFSQLLQNLLSNAIKYRKTEETPQIRVSAYRDGTEWIFSVADNSRGFDPQYAERIFGLFQRLGDRDTDGTGLGLCIARKIVERHGGRIWAESKPGFGSVFYFSLPANLEAKISA